MMTEIDVLGVYISPYAPILVACWILALVARLCLARAGLLLLAWHPALLVFALFVAAFSSAVLLAAAR